MGQSLAIWWAAARPKTLPAALCPVLVAGGLALGKGVFDAGAAALCLAFALLAQVAANYANDYYDGQRGADGADRLGPVRAVASGQLAPAAMKRATLLVVGLAFLAGLGLVLWGGGWLLPVGVAALVCAVAYTGGPYPLAYHGWGDVFVIVFFGFVAVMGTYFVQAGTLTWEAPVLGGGCGLLVNSLLVVNNRRDIAGDRRAGKRTLAVRWGVRFCLGQYVFQMLVAFALPLVLWAGGWGLGVFLPWLLLPLAVGCCLDLARLEGRALNGTLARTGVLVGLYGLLAGLGLALSPAGASCP